VLGGGELVGTLVGMGERANSKDLSSLAYLGDQKQKIKIKKVVDSSSPKCKQGQRPSIALLFLLLFEPM
jgi:hypothetical protein